MLRRSYSHCLRLCPMLVFGLWSLVWTFPLGLAVFINTNCATAELGTFYVLYRRLLRSRLVLLSSRNVRATFCCWALLRFCSSATFRGVLAMTHALTGGRLT